MPVVIPLYTNLLHFRYASGERICAREPFIMSRTFRNLALSAALLAASTGSSFASAHAAPFTGLDTLGGWATPERRPVLSDLPAATPTHLPGAGVVVCLHHSQ